MSIYLINLIFNLYKTLIEGNNILSNVNLFNNNEINNLNMNNSNPNLNIKNRLLFNRPMTKDLENNFFINNNINEDKNENCLFYNSAYFNNREYNSINNNNYLLENNIEQNPIINNSINDNFLNYNQNIFNDFFQRENDKNINEYFNLINNLQNENILNKRYNNIQNYKNNNLNNYKHNTNFNLNKDEEFNFININKNINLNKNNICSKNKNLSLTQILCNKIGINQIKKILEINQYNLDLIRKIILLLKEESGLHIVFENIYGNYFIQDLFQKMNNDLIQLTIDLISSEFINIAKTPSGTHCLQELLNYIKTSQMEISIIKSIRYQEKEMAFDDYATYVLQKIITIIPDTKRVRLNNIIIENAKELSLNANSVFVIKKFISTNTIEENKKKILNILKKNFLLIAQSPFGNYVIQHIFDVWPLEHCDSIINEILDKVNELSCQRFSSNIIIKALKIFTNNYKNKLIFKLCFSGDIFFLLRNKCGLYVINKVIEYMDNNTKKKFELLLKKIINKCLDKEKILINQIIYKLN